MINISDVYPFKKKLVSFHLSALPPISPIPLILTCLSRFCSNILPIYFIITGLHLSVEHQQKEPVFIRNKDVEH